MTVLEAALSEELTSLRLQVDALQNKLRLLAQENTALLGSLRASEARNRVDNDRGSIPWTR